MNAELFVADTHTPQWYTARRGGITASEIAAVLGIAPQSWASPFNLYHRKKSGTGEEYDNLAMKIGRKLEQVVLDEFRDRHPELTPLPTGLFRHPQRLWQLATPDSLLAEDGGTDPVAVVEAKTDANYDGWGDEGTDQIPVYYRAQVLWQMDVIGVPVGYVPVLFVPTRKYREYVIEYHDADCKLMRDAAEDFMRRLATDDEPPIDWKPATTRTLKALHPTVTDETASIERRLATRYRAAHKRNEIAKRALDQAQNELRAAMGTAARAAVGDELVATRLVYDRKPYEVKATTIDQLRIAKPKGDHK